MSDYLIRGFDGFTPGFRVALLVALVVLVVAAVAPTPTAAVIPMALAPLQSVLVEARPKTLGLCSRSGRRVLLR